MIPQAFFDNLKLVATSPYALIGYLALIIAWVFITLKNQRLTIISKLLSNLPQKDRLEILKKEYNVIPKNGLEPEQWIKTRKHLFLLYGFISFIIAITILCLTALLQPFSTEKNTSEITNSFNTNTYSANGINSTAFIQGVNANNISVNVDNSTKTNYAGQSTNLQIEMYYNELTTPISDHDIISLNEDRRIRFRIKNIGEVAVVNVSISVFLPLKENNIVKNGWGIQAPPINPKTLKEINGLLHLWSVSAGSIAEQSWFRTPILEISHSLPSPLFRRYELDELGFEFKGTAIDCPSDFSFHVLPIIIHIHADGSKDIKYNLFLRY